jgi:hypothetical protein
MGFHRTSIGSAAIAGAPLIENREVDATDPAYRRRHWRNVDFSRYAPQRFEIEKRLRLRMDGTVVDSSAQLLKVLCSFSRAGGLFG